MRRRGNRGGSDRRPGLCPRTYMLSREDGQFFDRIYEKSRDANGVDYFESRDWYDEKLDIQVSFVFITRCWYYRVRRIVKDLEDRCNSYIAPPPL